MIGPFGGVGERYDETTFAFLRSRKAVWFPEFHSIVCYEQNQYFTPNESQTGLRGVLTQLILRPSAVSTIFAYVKEDRPAECFRNRLGFPSFCLLKRGG